MDEPFSFPKKQKKMKVEKKRRNISEIIWIIQPTWMEKSSSSKKFDEMNFFEKGEEREREREDERGQRELLTWIQIFLLRNGIAMAKIV